MTTATTDDLYRLSRDLYSDPTGVLATLATLRLPKRLPIRAARLAIVQRLPFDAGNMSARVGRYGTGFLPSDWVGTFYRDTADGRAFIVYSYETPIAWERSDGLRTVPPVRYSVSTARHQREVRAAWSMPWGRNFSHPTKGMDQL